MYKVLLDKRVVKDLKKIDKKNREKILAVIEEKIAANPYEGKKLLGDLSDFYRYRVGNYRIIYSIFDDRIEIEIIKIGHRKEVYSK
ncbi:type II toxin-antitoxin system RelE family toxin [Nitrosophilus labii]|uniref:type II toxin-antitoxin system RelE family toxin n=1 Tax=Nitrosophilus labii TaxID=2706014 RepID=UPI001656DFB4|nr:type II toxin-antitoxin system RelE/ParE family toxin [Nitrosophilus labii]